MIPYVRQLLVKRDGRGVNISRLRTLPARSVGPIKYTDKGCRLNEQNDVQSHPEKGDITPAVRMTEGGREQRGRDGPEAPTSLPGLRGHIWKEQPYPVRYGN